MQYVLVCADVCVVRLARGVAWRGVAWRARVRDGGVTCARDRPTDYSRADFARVEKDRTRMREWFTAKYVRPWFVVRCTWGRGGGGGGL
jgi:hypothetical protein